MQGRKRDTRVPRVHRFLAGCPREADETAAAHVERCVQESLDVICDGIKDVIETPVILRR